MNQLTLAILDQAVRSAAAIRAITTLVPAGGLGDKVFPPTFSGKEGAAYATERRRVNGHEVDAVLLDSVASQANRHEEALQEAWDAGDIAFPLVATDFTGDPELRDLGKVSALQAPHRIADAILRDSTLDGVPFRYSPMGQSFVDARPTYATPLYRICPHALIFGVWDSTGPKGGLGAKFQRALVSEIVGFGSVKGVKTSSRIDPLGIEKGPIIYVAKDAVQTWTLNKEEAASDGGKPRPFGAEGKSGAPSAVNHGNIVPSIDANTGGFTLDEARQTLVLSLPALRRLRFPTNVAGADVPATQRPASEAAARTLLAALALCAVVGQRMRGFDLRSRALLVPTGPLVLEVLPADGGPAVPYTLDEQSAHALFAEARTQAAAVGMDWDLHEITLQPAPKLATLVKLSRNKAAASDGPT